VGFNYNAHYALADQNTNSTILKPSQTHNAPVYHHHHHHHHHHHEIFSAPITGSFMGRYANAEFLNLGGTNYDKFSMYIAQSSALTKHVLIFR